MKITIYQNREVYKEESKIGNDSENKVETLEFEFPEEYEDFTKYIEFQIKGEKYVDLIEDNKYVITREVAKYGKIKTQLVLKKNIENDVLIFKSNVFELNVSKSINASENLVNTVGVDLIEKIITKNNEQDTRLNNLELDNTTNKENISNLQNDNTTNKTNIKSLQDDNEVNKTDISNIKQEQTTQNTNISNLQTDNTSNKAKILDLEAKNTELDTNIQKNTDDIAEINAKNTAQDEEIAQIKEKDTAQDSLIEELQTKVVNLEAENTTLKNQIPSGEATGSPIHLTDSSDMECEIAVVGNSEQETRSGSNLLNFNVTQDSRVTVNDDGTVTINGTGGFSLNISQITLKSGVTYYEKVQLMSGEITSTENLSIEEVFMGFNSSNWITTDSFLSYTPSEDVSKTGIWVNAGATFKNAVIKLWANTDKSDFEPYGASPSPDYPSEIVTVGQNGSVEIEVCNKNLAKINESVWELTENNTIKNKARNNDAVLATFKLRKGQTANINLVLLSKPSTSTTFFIYKNGKEYVNGAFNNFQGFSLNTIYTRTITATEDIEISSKLWGNANSETFEFQFWAEIDEVTDYIPHESYTKVLPIQEEMLEGDYIEDVEHHGWGKYEITGNEDWKKSGNPNNISYYLIINSILVNIDGNTFSPSSSGSETKVAIVLSNHFKAISPNQLFKGSENGICLNWVGGEKEMRLGFGLDSDINTVDKLKAWLKSLYDAGTPVIVYYKLATPKSLELIEDQKSVLNSFYTYKGITNISVDGIGTLKVNYKKDLETIINNLSATSVAE